MKIDHTLKYAISATLALLAIVAPENATAIGLGDMDVKSHLGQPLRAKVKLHGISNLTDKDCFQLSSNGDSADIVRSANFKLINVIGDEATLLVSSNEVMNEPILNLSLVSECESTVRRDYVLLLDPILTASEDEISNVPAEANQATLTQSQSAKSKHKPSIQHNIDSEDRGDATKADIAALPAQSKRQSKIKRDHSSQKIVPVLHDDSSPNNSQTVPSNQVASANKIESKTADSKTTANLKKAEELNTKKSKQSVPHLSISGGNLGNASTANNTLALRLDSQLHFSPSENPQAFSAEAEVLDEVTVMNNRLAHLEKQLTTLQKRNSTLEIAGKEQSIQIEHDKKQTSILHWLTYMLGAALLAGAVFAVDWWQRRKQRLQLENDSTWNLSGTAGDPSRLFKHSNIEDENFVHDIGSVTPENELVKKSENQSLMSDDDLDKTPVKPAFMASQVESVVVKEDILDQADVFLSHGRTNLAIQLLQNHLSEFPDRSMTAWLFLLDLLATERLEAKYNATALECKMHFNIELPNFALPSASNGNSLESFNVLTSHLTHVWNTDEAVPFLDNLIYNNRLQPRSGFNHGTFEELGLLKSIAQDHAQIEQIIPLFQKSPNTKATVDFDTKGLIADKKVEGIVVEKNTTEKPEVNFEFNLVEWNRLGKDSANPARVSEEFKH